MKKKRFYNLIVAENNRRKGVENELNLRLRQQEAIAWLGEYAIGCQDLDLLFDQTVELVANVLGMEYCKILELQPGGEELLLRAGVGWKAGLVGQALVGTGLDSQAGYTLVSEDPVIVQDLRTETRFSGPELLTSHGVVSGMSVTISGRGGPFGVLGVHTQIRRNFQEHDTRFVKAIANILASAVDRLQVEAYLRQSRNELAIILDRVSEGITVQEPSGKLIFLNPAAAQFLGFDSVQAALDTPLPEVMQRFEILDENGQPFSPDNFPGRQVLQGLTHAEARVRFRMNGAGADRWSIVEAAPILNEAGEAVQAVNIFRDITEMVHEEQYQSLLAQAGALLASSLDYKTTISNVAQLAVTNLADWCTVYLVDETDQPERLVVAHKDPQKIEMARTYQQRFSTGLNSEDGVARVLRTGQAEYYPLITAEMLRASARDADHLAMMLELGMRSVIIVPLIARGRTLGAITLIWAESGGTYTQRDIDLINELARRAALAIDNALLYQKAQEINADLELRVARRTRQLEQSNTRLMNEVEERKRTEAALMKSETLLNSLFESAPDAVVLVDRNGKLARVNEAAEELFGYQREELVGKSIDRLLPQRLRKRHARHRANYFNEMSRRLMAANMDLMALTKAKQEIPVDIMLSPVQTDEGELIICAIRNITEQKRLQADLAETHRRLLESIEGERLRISQELHDGPIQELYGIALTLETFRDVLSDPNDSAVLMENKENVQAVIHTLRNMCGELRPPTLTQLGLEKAIRSHLIKVRETHPELDIETNLMSDGALLSDRVRLALFRVYQNSISNILRHAQARHVLVDFRLTDAEISLSVQDDGVGFHLPEKWLDLAREGHFGLVGMVERVEAIGGQMLVELAVGQGTTIRVVVPLESALLSPAPSLNGVNAA